MPDCVDPDLGLKLFAQACLSEYLGSLQYLQYEPYHEKTCLRDFRPGKTQTGLLV